MSTFKTIKQHRTVWPQIYEVKKGDITKFKVSARKSGYQGKQTEEFDKLSDAKERAAVIADDVKKGGVTEASITTHERIWIIKGKEMLEPFNVTFEECFKREVEYQKQLRLHTQNSTVGQLVKEWYEHCERGTFKKLRQASLQGLKVFSRSFGEVFGDKIVSKVTSNDLKVWLTNGKAPKTNTPWSMTTKRNKRVYAHTFFQWVIEEKEQIKTNPAKFKIKVSNDDVGEIHILTNDQVKAILDECVKSDTRMVPYFALSFFAGLRPLEAQRMKAKNLVNHL